MMNPAQSLADRMRQLAATHDRGAELTELADKLDAAAAAQDATLDTTKRLLGAWARARRLWCDCTGEPLV